MTHILLVDDDHDITHLLAGFLARFGFATSCAGDAQGMRAILSRTTVDLVVLDWMLPGTDGLALAREVRAQSAIPVIMLTARSSRLDCVLSLESGADDHMSKPFEPRELVARIQAVLRRSRAAPTAPTNVETSNVVGFDGWQLHRLERHLVSPAGAVLPLSNAEYRLLCVFTSHPRKLLTRGQLLDEARGREAEAFDRSIDLLVSRLRGKLVRGDEGADLIKTVRGAGYLFAARQVQPLMRWGA